MGGTVDVFVVGVVVARATAGTDREIPPLLDDDGNDVDGRSPLGRTPPAPKKPETPPPAATICGAAGEDAEAVVVEAPLASLPGVTARRALAAAAARGWWCRNEEDTASPDASRDAIDTMGTSDSHANEEDDDDDDDAVDGAPAPSPSCAVASVLLFPTRRTVLSSTTEDRS